jgi:hypothetical protein
MHLVTRQEVDTALVTSVADGRAYSLPSPFLGTFGVNCRFDGSPLKCT